MAITGYELLTVQGDYITIDLLVWRRYRVRAPAIVERTLDDNPHVAALHRTSPFLPVGTKIRIPIDPDILSQAPTQATIVKIWSGRAT